MHSHNAEQSTCFTAHTVRRNLIFGAILITTSCIAGGGPDTGGHGQVHAVGAPILVDVGTALAVILNGMTVLRWTRYAPGEAPECVAERYAREHG